MRSGRLHFGADICHCWFGLGVCVLCMLFAICVVRWQPKNRLKQSSILQDSEVWKIVGPPWRASTLVYIYGTFLFQGVTVASKNVPGFPEPNGSLKGVERLPIPHRHAGPKGPQRARSACTRPKAARASVARPLYLKLHTRHAKCPRLDLE